MIGPFIGLGPDQSPLSMRERPFSSLGHTRVWLTTYTLIQMIQTKQANEPTVELPTPDIMFLYTKAGF